MTGSLETEPDSGGIKNKRTMVFQVLVAGSSFCSASPPSPPPSVLPESDPAVPLEADPGDAAPHRLPSGVAASSERGLEEGLAPVAESGVLLALRSPWGAKVASRLMEGTPSVTAVGETAFRRGLWEA